MRPKAKALGYLEATARAKQQLDSWLKGPSGLLVRTWWQVLRLRCATLRMTNLWGRGGEQLQYGGFSTALCFGRNDSSLGWDEGERSLRDTPPFAKAQRMGHPECAALRPGRRTWSLWRGGHRRCWRRGLWGRVGRICSRIAGMGLRWIVPLR